MNGLGACVGVCGAIPCCPLPNPYREVQQGTVGLISRFGNFYKAADPGLVQVNVCTESLRVVDVKIQIVSIGRQTVITRDNVNVDIDSVIYFQIVNPYRAAFGITDLRQALVERAQTTLRHVVGARTVQSVVVERETIALEIDSILSEVCDKWGVKIEGILIKDIIFSPEVSASLSSAAQQKRIGEAKVIAAKAEVDAARLMRQAADILASPAAMQIRQLDALQGMAKTSSSKVIFVPMNLQSDVIGQLARQQVADGEGEGGSAGPAYTAGMINSVLLAVQPSVSSIWSLAIYGDFFIHSRWAHQPLPGVTLQGQIEGCTYPAPFMGTPPTAPAFLANHKEEMEVDPSGVHPTPPDVPGNTGA